MTLYCRYTECAESNATCMRRHRVAEVSSVMEARSFSCLYSSSFPLTGLESTFLLVRSLHDSIRDTGTNIQKKANFELQSTSASKHSSITSDKSSVK
jgi:hypothetical protein